MYFPGSKRDIWTFVSPIRGAAVAIRRRNEWAMASARLSTLSMMRMNYEDPRTRSSAGGKEAGKGNWMETDGSKLQKSVLRVNLSTLCRVSRLSNRIARISAVEDSTELGELVYKI